MNGLINYIIGFLIGSEKDSGAIDAIGYTSDESAFNQYKIVIIPSGFFNEENYGKASSLPTMPLKNIDGVPILYGKPIIEKKGETIVIYADIIASSYFLLTRYEEWIRPECRDEHGRFPGEESVPYKGNFIHRPIVDEYGQLLRKYLREAGITTPKPVAGFNKIYLTHDIDIPFIYRTWRNLANTLLKNIKNFPAALKIFFGNVETDPFFTFPWILKQNKKVSAETIFFIKSTIKPCIFDNPYYKLSSKDIQYLFRISRQSGATIGLHCSYLSSDEPDLISEEKKKLEKHSTEKICYNRNHYLRCKEPQDMQSVINAGITDDFTIGYADVAGFRLGTCRAVKWINVENKDVSELILHPLTIMDVSLSETKYMDLSYQEALEYAQKLIEEVKKFNGDLTLLWHNNTLSDSNGFGHKKLYSVLLDYLE